MLLVPSLSSGLHQNMFLNFRQNTIHYTSYGTGEELIFCLHGYGETGEIFECLTTELGSMFTLICPDLPLHGKTNWKEPAFEPADLDSIFLALAEKEFSSGRLFGLAGYSIGGRLVMAYAEKFPGRVNRLILLATDGLRENSWYWLATQTNAGNRLFRYTMNNPKWLFAMMELAIRLKLLNQSIYKFTHLYLDDATQRDDLYARWTLFRNFRPNVRRLKEIIRRQKILLLLFFGIHDRIITVSQASRLMEGSGNESQLIVLETGHRLLKPALASDIAEKILQPLPA